MADHPIYRGWDVLGKASRSIKRSFTGYGLTRDAAGALELGRNLQSRLGEAGLDGEEGRHAFARSIAETAALTLGVSDSGHPLIDHWTSFITAIIEAERWFELPLLDPAGTPARSELWDYEDAARRIETILDQLDEVHRLASAFLAEMMRPVLANHPALIAESDARTISFETNLVDLLQKPAELVERLVQLPFAPDFDDLALFPGLRTRLEYNLNIASGGSPTEPVSGRSVKLPTRQSGLSTHKLVDLYLAQTPIADLLDYPLRIALPETTRFEHMHIVAGSGHGKTQTLQHLILHDLDRVARGETSIVVIDSQSDLINTIAGLDVFAPNGPLAERLVLIDPTDIEYPVALNLFDVGMDRLEGYSQLDRERLTNSILELYDFVLGTLLDAGMTQKQTVIFRYITRLLLHIPGATIHTLRELLEDGGYDKYRSHMAKLQGSARAFFEHEFNGKEFVATRRQVLRRLYGILENQTFERMFSHPKSKLDLFTEMNSGKVILINTAKDLLKENGTQILGRFFIAMIAQAAQERAVLAPENRLPTFVYIDEANDYFDRNIAIILSQARKYNIGMILAHQFLGQLDTKLHEAISANTAIKFAGGVSAKDARALANDLRTDPSFIEGQRKLSFAAFIKGETDNAASIAIEPGQMEAMPRMEEAAWEALRDAIRAQYAVHYSELNLDGSEDDGPEPDTTDADGNGSEDGGSGEGRNRGPRRTDPPGNPNNDDLDNGEPMKW